MNIKKELEKLLDEINSKLNGMGSALSPVNAELLIAKSNVLIALQKYEQ